MRFGVVIPASKSSLFIGISIVEGVEEGFELALLCAESCGKVVVPAVFLLCYHALWLPGTDKWVTEQCQGSQAVVPYNALSWISAC